MSKKIAIISDLHANLEALEACIQDIDGLGDVDAIYCLGDIVGYGPEPTPVIDIVDERCEFCLLGNHDHALLNMPLGFNRIAAKAIECQRSALEPGIFSSDIEKHRWEYLQNLEEERIIDGDVFVHASPRDKIFEYILPTDPVRNPEKLVEVFKHIERRCYVGHTHLPGIMTEEPNFYTPEELDHSYTFQPDEKLVINVSSVGQPRDRDPRACYATITDTEVAWRRVEYDVQKTVEKVKKDPCLDDYCGLRLVEGK